MSMNEVIGNAMTMDNLSEEVIRALFCDAARIVIEEARSLSED